MLEDFFTLAEIKDGISSVGRVGELISEIEKLENAVVLSRSYLIRQCSIAATTLASTKNQECLQRFVELKGVDFLNQWLLDAQKCGNEISNSAEDLIVSILVALEYLPDDAPLTYSGILPTVQHLFAHANNKINQKARILCQKWGIIKKCCTEDREIDTEAVRHAEASQKMEKSSKVGVGQVGPADVITEAKFPEPKKPESSFSKDVDVDDQNVSSSLDIKKGESLLADLSESEKNTIEDLNQHANISPGLQVSSEGESMGKEEGPTSSSDTDGEGTVNELRLKRCMNSFGDSSKATESKLTALKGGNSTSLTEYDDTDALEVARLVAIEVEREVIDYRGPFCDSPGSNSRRADSPDLEAHRQPEPPIDESNDNKSSSTGEESGISSSLKEDGSGITDDSGPFSRKHSRNAELGDFDLNENQCTEETDWHTKSTLSNSINLSAPVAVAASRASSVFPARLHFEGELGWRGSAATSAFRRASPRRTPEGEKSMSASSQKTSNMFDLNLADSDDVIAAEPLPIAVLAASTGLASTDTSVAVAASGGLGLDLNSPWDDDEAPLTTTTVPSFWNRQQITGNWGQPSSSLSSREPAVNSFDLNDNMPLMYGSSRGVGASTVEVSGKDISDLSAVTLMGKRIVPGQQEHSHQNKHTFLGQIPHNFLGQSQHNVLGQSQHNFPGQSQHNFLGQTQHNFLGPSVESRVPARPMQSYANTPPGQSASSYPSQSAVSYPPPFYAPVGVPYMVDAKGAPVMPPLPGMGVGFTHPSFSSRAMPPSSTESSYFHPSMGFNYAPSSDGIARREEGSYWPMPFQGQPFFVDERTRNISHGGSTSGAVSKRKEPDSAWDLFTRR